jgi:hypothetical protein
LFRQILPKEHWGITLYDDLADDFENLETPDDVEDVEAPDDAGDLEIPDDFESLVRPDDLASWSYISRHLMPIMLQNSR